MPDGIFEKCEKVANILEQSDIVWGRYGSDTITELAARIVNKLEEKEEESWI